MEASGRAKVTFAAMTEVTYYPLARTDNFNVLHTSNDAIAQDHWYYPRLAARWPGPSGHWVWPALNDHNSLRQ